MQKLENDGTAEQDNMRVLVPQPHGITTRDLVQILWHNRQIFLIAVIISLFAGLLYVNIVTPMYTSTARIYVEQAGPRILSETESVMTRSKNYLYTQAELVRSTPILSAALEKIGTADLKVFHDVDNPVLYLQEKRLRVTVGSKDDIINIASDSPDPNEAARLVNAVVDCYIAYHADQKRTTAGEVLRILQKEKRQRDKELADKLKAMTDFKSENIGLAFENRDGNIILDRLESLSSEMTRAEIQTVEAKTVYDNARSMMADPACLKRFVESERADGRYVSTAGEWARLETELERLELQLCDLRQRDKADPLEVAAVQEKISGVENRLAFLYRKFAGTQLAVAEQQYNTAKQQQEQIAAYLEAQRREALELNKQVATYTILQSEYEQTKKLSDILDDRIKEISVAEDVGALNISILESGRASDKPTSPPKVRYVALSALLGLMFAGVLVALRECLDQRLRSVQEVTSVLGMTVLGAVPSMSRKEGLAGRGQKVQLDLKSCAAEAYRTIRTAIFFGAPKSRAKILLVTSPTAGDGKSTTVSNLAIAMAQAGQKTLVLDADFRTASQHKLFGLSRKDESLDKLLDGTITPEELIQSTGVPGLELLSCGLERDNPSEILNGQSFAKLLKLLRKKYDRIVVDSPPIIPVADAQILAKICDTVVLVLRAEKSTRDASRQARDALACVGARVFGVVINDIPKQGRYGYYGSYGLGHKSSARNRRRAERGSNGKVRKPEIVAVDDFSSELAMARSGK